MTQTTINNVYSVATASSSTSLFVTYFSDSAPLSSNNQFPVGKRWVNITTGSEYILSPSLQWITLTTEDANLITFTGNSGGAVSPHFGNINIIGDVNTASSTGTPGASTLQSRVVLPTTPHSVLEKGSSGIEGISPSSTSGIPIVSNGSSLDASFSTLLVPGGGTGKIIQSPYSLLTAGTTTTAAFQEIIPPSSIHSVLVSNGSTTLPSFSDNADIYSGGISFDGGTTSLNIYKNKTSWTPGIRFGASPQTTTYSSQAGLYNRFNPIVFIYFEFQIATLPVQVGSAFLQGFPSAVNPGTPSYLQVYYENLILPMGATDVFMRILPGPIVNFLAVGSGGVSTQLDFSNFTSSTYISVTANYTF